MVIKTPIPFIFKCQSLMELGAPLRGCVCACVRPCPHTRVCSCAWVRTCTRARVCTSSGVGSRRKSPPCVTASSQRAVSAWWLRPPVPSAGCPGSEMACLLHPPPHGLDCVLFNAQELSAPPVKLVPEGGLSKKWVLVKCSSGLDASSFSKFS